MKFFWGVFFTFCLLATSTKADDIVNSFEESWTDSTYQQLSLDERIGQLIDLRVAPDAENIDELVNLITEHHIGSITISGGTLEACITLMIAVRSQEKVPVFFSVENHDNLGLPFDQIFQLPSFQTFKKANDRKLLLASIDALANIYKEAGIFGNAYVPNSLTFKEEGLFIVDYSELDDYSYYNNLAIDFSSSGIVPSTDFYLDLSNDIKLSAKALNAFDLAEKDKGTKSYKSQIFNLPRSIITLKSLPAFKENEASNFKRRVLDPLIEKKLEFKGVLSADFDAIKSKHTDNSDEDIARMLLKIGSEKLLVSAGVERVISGIEDGISNQYFKKNEIREKVKRMLMLKLNTFGPEPLQVNYDEFRQKVYSPELLNISFQVYSKALIVEEKGNKLMPFADLESTNFASLVLGFTESKMFQETLEKYAPFVHYKLPDIAFDPFDLKFLSDQLTQFDNVIVGLHTSGLLELDQTVLGFLKYLNEHTNIVLVIFGNSVSVDELMAIENTIYMHEDNLLTQQIAAKTIFTNSDEVESFGRLSYSMPEMQQMDSKVLKKIDQIVEEAISIGATPGAQVLVARNGSVVMERGYGYYTYDSIMSVDTRTIYDLASITKVAATTLAIMKLNEQGKISLDSAVGKYLPELQGSNKASLVIREILAHQSGLKAFYPFWRNTIEDEAETLHYYQDKPNATYNKTVAYGMFAAENLNDSLWHWTVDMGLRKRDEKLDSYDYKYSDLGFYLLQALVERVSDTSLDTYVDSVFYNSLGASTLTFNPLCRFPLKRIAPTERDNEFRRVLVWGTVHDQIAAMKGGVSGHAGLFGNSHDIAKIMQMQLQLGNYGGKQYLNEQTVKEFTSHQYESNRRGLGWDKPEKGEEYNPASRYASFKSFGHSGFTGTVVWADPTFNLIIVFLSNRIYPNSDNAKLIEFNIRERINDVVYESMWNFEKTYH